MKIAQKPQCQVINANNKYCGWYAIDASLLSSDREREAFSHFINWSRKAGADYRYDGLICFATQFNCAPQADALNPLHGKWSPLWSPHCDGIQEVMSDCKWGHIHLGNRSNPMCWYDGHIFYKLEMMPTDPIFDPNPSWPNAVEQGGIIYKEREIWDEVNRSLVLKNDSGPLRKYHQEGAIELLWSD